MKTQKIQLAIFASGGGSNALAIARYFQNHPKIRVSVLVTDNPHAGVVDLLAPFGIPAIKMEKGQWKNGDALNELLNSYTINYIVLAGYLKLIPATLIRHYPEKILNIHPALLPKFGGKGMYGMNIHQAVIAAKESVSGITIHLVDEIYDNGKILFQTQIPVSPQWSAVDLQQNILKLEHQHFPQIIEQTVLGK